MRLVAQGRARDNLNLLAMSPKESEEYSDYLIKLKSEWQGKVDLRLGIPLSNGEDGHVCTAGHEKLVIRYDGMVYPCEAYKYKDYIVNPRASGELSLCGTQMLYDLKDIAYPSNIKEHSIKWIYNNSDFLKYIKLNSSYIIENYFSKNC